MNNYLPTLEPDFDVKQELRFIGGFPDLHQFKYVFISCSGGKDSHAMAYLMSELADRQNYSKSQMELVYANTGFEWHDTFEQVKCIGAAVGIKAVEVLPKFKLLDNVRRRWAKFNGWTEFQGVAVAPEREREREREHDAQMAQWRVRSQTSRKDFAQVTTREQQYSKELLKSCTPFPFATRRFCTGEGKNNAIFQHIRDSKEDD